MTVEAALIEAIAWAWYQLGRGDPICNSLAREHLSETLAWAVRFHEIERAHERLAETPGARALMADPDLADHVIAERESRSLLDAYLSGR